MKSLKMVFVKFLEQLMWRESMWQQGEADLTELHPVQHLLTVVVRFGRLIVPIDLHYVGISQTETVA